MVFLYAENRRHETDRQRVTLNAPPLIMPHCNNRVIQKQRHRPIQTSRGLTAECLASVHAFKHPSIITANIYTGEMEAIQIIFDSLTS